MDLGSLYGIIVLEFHSQSNYTYSMGFQMVHYFLKSVHSFILNFWFVILAKMDQILVQSTWKKWYILQDSTVLQ